MVGIYLITNQINQKRYVGQSKYIENRLKEHKVRAFRENDGEYNTPLHQAFRKYGIENFKFEILEECNLEQLDKEEKYYIDLYKTYPVGLNKGYNQTPGGQNPSSKAFPHIDEITKLLKESNLTQKEISKQFNITEEMIQGINTGRYWRRDNINYPIRKRKTINGYLWGAKIKKYCPICGKEILPSSKHCKGCALKELKIPIPSREEILKAFYELKSCQKVASKYDISTMLLKKWREELKLPSKVSDTIQLYQKEYLK